MQGETTKPPIKMQFNPLIPELIFFQIPICIQGTADVLGQTLQNAFFFYFMWKLTDLELKNVCGHMVTLVHDEVIFCYSYIRFRMISASYKYCITVNLLHLGIKII